MYVFKCFFFLIYFGVCDIYRRIDELYAMEETERERERYE